jgi:hypothetical protein
MKKSPVPGPDNAPRLPTRGVSDFVTNSHLAPVDSGEYAADLVVKNGLSEHTSPTLPSAAIEASEAAGESGDALTVYLRQVHRGRLCRPPKHD